MKWIVLLFVYFVLFIGVAQAQSQQNVLSDKDIQIYKEIFSAQSKGQFEKAKSAEKKLKNKLLLGYVLYDRYFSKRYKTQKGEVVSWLKKYNDLAIADDMYALGQQKKADLTGLKPKGLFGSRTGACTYVTRTEPIDLIKNVSFSYLSQGRRVEAQKLMRQIGRYLGAGKTLNARKLIDGEKADNLFNKFAHNSARTALAFSYFLDNENELALQYARQAMRGSGSDIPLASWAAGLAAWRLNDYQAAADYFEKTAGLKKTYPLLRAASAFWAASSK